MTDISSEAERLAREFDARVKQFDRIVAETPESVRALRADRGEETREQHVKTAATLRAQAERIKELEDDLAGMRAEGKRMRREVEISRNNALREAAEVSRQISGCCQSCASTEIRILALIEGENHEQ